MKSAKNKKCPYCGSSEGYYMTETTHRSIYYNFDDETIGPIDDTETFTGVQRYCLSCFHELPKEMFLYEKTE